MIKSPLTLIAVGAQYGGLDNKYMACTPQVKLQANPAGSLDNKNNTGTRDEL